MSTITARPKAAKLTRPCCSCKAVEAMVMFPRCGECHVKEWKAAYRGPIHAGLRRVLELSNELNALTNDLIAEMSDPGFARTKLARFMGEDCVYYTVRDLRAIEYATNVGITFQNDLYTDPSKDE